MSLFGQPSSSLFGQNNQQQQNKPSPFGSANTNTATSQPQQGGGLFGASQSQQGTGLFGSSQPQQQGSLLGATQPQPQGGLFGATQPQQQGGLFGSSQSQQQGGLFGATSKPAQTGSIFGSTQQQQQPQAPGGGLFGGLGSTSTQQPQQPTQQQQGSSLFRGFGQSSQPAEQNQQQGTSLGQSQGRLFQQSEVTPRQKSVVDQIELAFSKWNPQSTLSLFHTYLYNSVPPESAPFYGPTPQDDETKWEEALSKKPSPGAIPVLVKGFEQIGQRMEMQSQSLQVLRGRLHEINDGLNSLLQKHDLQISVRAAECRRRHITLSHQCLRLAAKTQVLRNRGYAMDSAEEELRQKLLLLERNVFDPALTGRGEEIWARMVSVRERGRQLQREFEKSGRGLSQHKEQVIDEEVMRRAKKILEDYDSQLKHLAKELAQIQKSWADSEQSKPFANAIGSGR